MAQTTDLSNLDNQTSQIFGTGALVTPAGTNAQRPKTPQVGMLRLNTTINKLEYYGTKWSDIVNTEDGDARYVTQAAPKIGADMDAQGHNIKNLPSTPVDNTAAINLNYLNPRLDSGVGINAERFGNEPPSYYATQFDVIILNSAINQVASDLNLHVTDLNNPHQTTKAQVGLDRVDNTNDLEKPISTLTQAALNTKVNKGGDTMQGNLSMGGFNLVDVMNFVGSVWYFALPAAPAGFLEADGAEYFKADYPRLYAKIGDYYSLSTTPPDKFKTPDLRGMFMRGLDKGRGIDPEPGGRVLGSSQADTNLAHNHGGNTADAGPWNITAPAYSSNENSLTTDVGTRIYAQGRVKTSVTTPTGTVPAHHHAITNDGGAEARPKNVAMLVCIMI